ncbi:dephospho-CoA kinase [Diplocloster agilis]|uniref:Dephospho-CoA kinase n=1 Tax=Diplocloster agilis TaxID=2850323 RepID=A0A949JYJ8_9FIRM|nr:dephospho-CoA kinase [Diplocloster agilis]MBU9737585.1 dephospho-CoA kinase [Diplocloster agilis]
MKVIGITGGVGSGKSTILEYIGRVYNARVIQADKVGHLMMETGQPGYYQVVETFGSGILNGDQTVNRAKLSALVFEKPELLAKLEKIIHPAVKAYIVEEIDKERTAGKLSLVLVEAALLIEDNYRVLCDEFWYIYAADEIRRERLKRWRGYSDEKVDRIMAHQMSAEEYRRHCEEEIDNNGELSDVYGQIDQIMKKRGIHKRQKM